ncbi:MAG: metallophosphoesterase family protein [Planctomycetota bacterium]
MKLAWASDVHLVFLSSNGRGSQQTLQGWLKRLASESFDALAISGDISEAPCLHEHLGLLEKHVARPIYFVLGNHDYYRGSIARVLPAVRTFTATASHLHCMETIEYIELNSKTALVGHGCWGDGGYGDLRNSCIMLNDWKLIEELKKWRRGPWSLTCMSSCGKCEEEVTKLKVHPEDLDRESIAEQLYALGQRAAEHLRQSLPQALQSKPNVVLLTHTPPFAPRCVRTKTDWDAWAPHAGCKAAGDVIQEVMQDFPHRRLLILSGHVHCSSCIQVSRNIEQRTAAAQYGAPGIEETIELPSTPDGGTQ